MAVSFRSIGALGAGNVGTTSLSINYPTAGGAPQSGDLLLLVVFNKYPTNGPSTPSGYNTITNGQASGGEGSAGIDAGTVYVTVFSRIADGTESGAVSVSIPSGNSSAGAVLCYQKGSGTWDFAATNGSDNSGNSTSWSITGAADPGVTAGDMLIALNAINSDGQTFSSQAMSQSGITFGTATERVDAGTNQGDDVGGMISDHVVSSGTSSGVPTYTATASASATNRPAGACVILRIRETTGTTGDAALSQTAQTVSSSGTVTITGSATLTQDGGAVSATGTILITGSAAVTQDGQTVSAIGAVPITGDANLTQEAQGISAIGEMPISSGAALAQDGQTTIGAGTVSISGAAALVQDDNTLSSTGTILISGDATLTQEAHTLSADSGAISGSLALTQDGQSIAAVGVVGITGSASIVQGGDSAVASGAVLITGEAATIPQTSQTLSAVADVVGDGGSLAVTQADQSVAGIGTVGITASVTLTQQAHGLSAVAVIPITGTAGLTQSQTLSASGTVGATDPDEFMVGTVVPLDIIRTVALLTAVNSLCNLNAHNSVRPIE